MSQQRSRLFFALLCAAVLAAYANHFQNGFHFDDSHTIVDNPFLRDIRNVPRFFTDTTMFSVLPANQTYRPVVPASLAIDYWFAGGLKPFTFQLSTFLWFLVQLGLMVTLYRRLLAIAAPTVPALYRDAVALLATAWYGLHPAIAETVNYVIQRGDLYATLGCIAGLVLYLHWPLGRKTGLYLLPVVVANLAKPPALVFPALLAAWLYLFDNNDDKNRRGLSGWWRALGPPVLVTIVMAVLQVQMTPKHYTPGLISAHDYLLTQPYVAWRYFVSFFLPIHLTADTDLAPLSTAASGEALLGFAFLAALAFAIHQTARHPITRPIAFGLIWFVVALVPTAIFPLAEVENDHRMFFPFVGLALSAVWSAFLLIQSAPMRKAALPVSFCLLAAYAWGTHVRNEVWHDDASLWLDTTEKSPHNGRGLMNYGLTLMGKGQYGEALAYFERAHQYTPNYHILEINTAIAEGALNHPAEAERHFQRASVLAPQDSLPDFYYGRWLLTVGRVTESIPPLQRAIQRNPALLDARHSLMQAYAMTRNRPALTQLANETLQIAPGDAIATVDLRAAQQMQDPLTAAEVAVQAQPTAENYLALSLAYHQARRFEDSLHAAQEALKRKPQFPEAYNNIAAAYEELKQWDNAIAAAQQALQLRPDFTLARNNLVYSMQQKQLAAHH